MKMLEYLPLPFLQYRAQDVMKRMAQVIIQVVIMNNMTKGIIVQVVIVHHPHVHFVIVMVAHQVIVVEKQWVPQKVYLCVHHVVQHIVDVEIHQEVVVVV